jgi:SAM-dependent methyltransferase
MFLYRGVGFEERPMSFLPDGCIGEGAAECEVHWDIREDSDGVGLEIFSLEGRTCRLLTNSEGRWVGHWDIHGRRPVEIAPKQKSPVMNLDADCFPHLGPRAHGFRKMREFIFQLAAGTNRLVIVETGCVRKYNDWHGDGNSTRILNEIAGEVGAQFFTIDIKPKHCALARKLCPNARVICGDSVMELYRLRQVVERIDLLYLDSYDLDWDNPHPSSLHHFKELCAASSLLKSGSVVFVDDNHRRVGKGMYVRDYMRGIGAILIHDGYQIGFVLP